MKRIFFAGSTDFSMPILKMLAGQGLICAVLSAEDKPRGRGLKLMQNPVVSFAKDNNIAVLQPQFLRADLREEIKRYKPDVLVCAAYGKIFGPKFLALFPDGAINVHPSLLPKFRGPAPVPASILVGEIHTGVTLQTMALQMDCGKIILQTNTSIKTHETSTQLITRLADDAAQTVKELFENFDTLYASATQQDDTKATYCLKIHSSLGYISWMESAQQIVYISRALGAPYGGCKAYYCVGNKKIVIKLWETHVYDDRQKSQNISSDKTATAGTVLGFDKQHGILIQTVEGILACTQLQLPGRKRLPWKAFLQGEPHILKSQLC